jgi:3-oxosteroid 1-dehydrogenase
MLASNPAEDSSWDQTVDFLVVGSGAAGLTGALAAADRGARVLVIEKSRYYGGATALSGGAIWVPGNHLMEEIGIEDSLEEGLLYLDAATAGTSSRGRLLTYLEEAPAMVRDLAETSHVIFEPVADYPDYYPELAGGKAGGRTIEPARFNAMRLGDELDHLRPSLHSRRMRFLSLMARNVAKLIAGGLPLYRKVAKDALFYYGNLPARMRRLDNTRLTLGRSLVARLRLSLMERKVPLLLETRIVELIEENGRIMGAVAESGGRPLRIRARRGVLLAAGGFERNADLRRTHQPAPIGTDWSAGPESNTGDTIEIGEKIGADFDLLHEAWWTPVLRAPGDAAAWVMVIEKGLPGGIIVNAAGERFMNEAAPYNDVVKAMYAANRPEAPSIPGHLIFDARFRKRYPVGSVEPSYTMPDRKLSPNLKQFLTSDSTLSGLAEKIGVDPKGLERTVERVNEFARIGKDSDFGRGESLQDRYYGDPRTTPNPCLGPILEPPFYSVEVQPGDLGTKGGLRTDEKARVLRSDGGIIEGLYASGNCSASVMGSSYPGAGGTIGPAMTFGWIAGREAITS